MHTSRGKLVLLAFSVLLMPIAGCGDPSPAAADRISPTGPAAARVAAEITIRSLFTLDRTTIRPEPGNGTFTGSAEGEFSATGAIVEEGDESYRLTFTGSSAPNSNVIHGTGTFSGADGSWTLEFEALHLPYDDPEFDGRWVLTGGTGAYAGLRGGGSVEFLVEDEESLYPTVHGTWSGTVR